MFSDEAQFTRDGMYNSHNPRTTVLWGHQGRFSVNIWAGIVGDYLLGS